MKKRLLAVLLVSTMVLATGCGGEEPAPSEPATSEATSEATAEAASSEEPVTLTYGCWGKEQYDAYMIGLQPYLEAHPNITIEPQVTPWKDYWTKLETQIAAGAGPDIFWMNIPNAGDYIEGGILEPLDDLEIDMTKLPATHVEAYTRDGVLYGIPKDYDTNGLFYNKLLFDQAGVAYPDETWTWKEFSDAAVKLTNPEQGIYGFYAAPTYQGGYYDMMYQNGGSPFTAEGLSNFSAPENLEAMNFFYSFIENGSSVPYEEQLNFKPDAMMFSGKLAMYIGGSYDSSTFFGQQYGIDNIDVAPMPQGKTRGTASNALAHCVNAASPNIEEAKDLVEALTTPEVSAALGASGSVIPAYEGSEKSYIDVFPGKNVTVFTEAIDYATHLPNQPNVAAAQKVSEEIVAKIWTGEYTVEEGCKLIDEQSNEILAQ